MEAPAPGGHARSVRNPGISAGALLGALGPFESTKINGKQRETVIVAISTQGANFSHQPTEFIAEIIPIEFPFPQTPP